MKTTTEEKLQKVTQELKAMRRDRKVLIYELLALRQREEFHERTTGPRTAKRRRHDVNRVLRATNDEWSNRFVALIVGVSTGMVDRVRKSRAAEAAKGVRQ